MCLVGRPNTGKSTLLNQILRSKVAITSERPQTTRNAIRGIYTTEDAQLIFVDTPGVHKPQTALGTRLNRVVRDTLSEVEVIVLVVDSSEGVGGGDAFIAADLKQLSTPVIVALNKLDVTRIEQMDRAVNALREIADWEQYALSARTGEGVPQLLDAIVERLPEGPVLYPPDEKTDQPERQTIAELIREKALELTREEVPHSIAVVVDEIEAENDEVNIHAVIYVERDSQKGIVIGRAGKMLKEIGSRARRDIEELLGSHVYLSLHVKVERDWQRRDSLVARFGYGE